MILEKYLNKEVEIEEKSYQVPSTIHFNNKAAYGTNNQIEGIFTNFDEDFIELDNNQLINRKHIYRIILK